MPSPGPTHSAAIADLLYYSCFQVGGKLNKAFGCNMTDEAIFKVANSRLGLYRRCGVGIPENIRRLFGEEMESVSGCCSRRIHLTIL